MIRRATANSGSEWILIPQVEHARLAAELAAGWSDLAGGVGLGPHRDILVEAVRRHDDGWRTWDEQLAVDPQTGIPRDFTERTAEESHRIWKASIESGRGLGTFGSLGYF